MSSLSTLRNPIVHCSELAEDEALRGSCAAGGRVTAPAVDDPGDENRRSH
jgi:hypothetical protein